MENGRTTKRRQNLKERIEKKRENFFEKKAYKKIKAEGELQENVGGGVK